MRRPGDTDNRGETAQDGVDDARRPNVRPWTGWQVVRGGCTNGSRSEWVGVRERSANRAEGRHRPFPVVKRRRRGWRSGSIVLTRFRTGSVARLATGDLGPRRVPVKSFGAIALTRSFPDSDRGASADLAFLWRSGTSVEKMRRSRRSVGQRQRLAIAGAPPHARPFRLRSPESNRAGSSRNRYGGPPWRSSSPRRAAIRSPLSQS